MRNIITTAMLTAGIASVLCGCNKNEPANPASNMANPPTTMPAASPAASMENTKSPAAVAAPAVEAVKSAANDLAAKFVAQATSAADSQLGPIASELTTKVQALSAAVGANDTIKRALDSTLQSLAGGQDSTALASAFQLAEAAKLTPEQLGLAKEVGNLASAYAVQKNFSALEGAQGDVATIVNSLRKGEITAAIPALKNVADNTHLTDTQKQLVTSVADKYAPGWQKAGQVLDAVKKLPGF